MPDLLIDKEGHTTILTINRPDQMNSMGGTVHEDLKQAMIEFQQDSNQYVAIITGAGEKSFSAGGDLKAMAARSEARAALPISQVPDLDGVAACEKVTIAAVNGLAVAAGMELAISCDIRVAADHAWFGVFEVSRGSWPASPSMSCPGSCRSVPRWISLSRAVGSAPRMRSAWGSSSRSCHGTGLWMWH